MRYTIIVLLVLCLSGCAQLMVSPFREPAQSHCDKLFSSLDQAVVEEGVRDVQDRRVSVAPYLRVNRLLSSFRDDAHGDRFEHWLDAMQGLGINGWQIEYDNLSEKSQQALWVQAQSADPAPASFTQALTECAVQMRESYFESDAQKDALREAAVVKDNYSVLNRALGLYPLTALVFRKGISDWHEETRSTYGLSLNQLPVKGELRTFVTAADTQLDAAEVADILHRSSANPLQLPTPGQAELDALFATYAPIYSIDTDTEDDHMGMPVWSDDGQIHIDTSTPVVYRYPSYTRYKQLTLLQLNYVIWFPARTATSSMDLLAGELDGILWRVTLLPSGEPLVFDSIHMCGCYHLFFTGKGVTQLPAAGGLTEPALFLSSPGFSYDSLPLVIRIASGSHYIDKVYSQSKAPNTVEPYVMYDADRLRSLPWSGQQHRSLYGEDGLVSGSERLERFLFWPMGIPSAGAMRQPGHHATAFVGRRHFDDARLFESLLHIEEP